MKHLIIGNGVAGVTAAQAIVRADPAAEVHIFGAEPYPYYRRPRLWEYIAGEVEQEALYFRPAAWYAEQGIALHLGTPVVGLDPAGHRITLADGAEVEYDRLLLATGSRPFVPPCEGTDKQGVFTLRTLDDAQAIREYAGQVATAIIIGGGLLGLETARALRSAGLSVTVVEFAHHLLTRQLDAEGGEVLQAILEGQGLHIITQGATVAVLGDERASGIRLKDGREVAGELVLFSTGIRSEVALAREAGLTVERGVVVDRHLRTSAEDVYAAGDVAEFEGRVYGIIPAALEQAQAAAANMVAPGSQEYSGTLVSTTLKVVGAELASLGECVVAAEGDAVLRRADPAAGRYRKFVLRDGHLVGAILLNEKRNILPVKRLIERGADLSAYADRLLEDDFDFRAIV